MKRSFFFIIYVMLLVSLCGCKARTVTNTVEVPVQVETVRTEWRDRVVLHRDSVYLRDSIYVDRSRDTLLIERWHVATRDVVRHDTVRVEKRDTIREPVAITQTRTETVEVERRLRWWQTALIWLGAAALAFLLVYFGIRFLVKRYFNKIADIK